MRSLDCLASNSSISVSFYIFGDFPIFQNFNQDLGPTEMRNPHFTNEGDIMIWFSGITSVCIVNMTNLSAREIQNLLPSFKRNDKPVALRCVAKNQGKKLLVAYLLNGDYKLGYYEAGGDAIHLDINEKFSNSKFSNFCIFNPF